ncbi:unnamed protein product [Trichogramma brassicae]|uniref:Uncharacterized protein n=1 Tax=Trichogramma brassicae TaxID=86971 RepID=A0A6H5IPF9_9HYME|nr:unnamed protein product [Trichogramma brassicae]
MSLKIWIRKVEKQASMLYEQRRDFIGSDDDEPEQRRIYEYIMSLVDHSTELAEKFLLLPRDRLCDRDQKQEERYHEFERVAFQLLRCVDWLLATIWETATKRHFLRSLNEISASLEKILDATELLVLELKLDESSRADNDEDDSQDGGNGNEGDADDESSMGSGSRNYAVVEYVNEVRDAPAVYASCVVSCKRICPVRMYAGPLRRRVVLSIYIRAAQPQIHAYTYTHKTQIYLLID